MQRQHYYISPVNSMSPYPTEFLVSRLKHVGAKYVRTANKFGWNNQPKVVCFSCDQELRKTIEDALPDSMRVWLHWRHTN